MTPTERGRRAVEAYAAMRYGVRRQPIVHPLWIGFAGFVLALVLSIFWSAR